MATKSTAKAAPVKAVAKKRNNTKAQLLGKTVEHVDIDVVRRAPDHRLDAQDVVLLARHRPRRRHLRHGAA